MITNAMYKAAITRKTWITKEEHFIPIPKMTSAHIIASLNKCIQDHWRTRYILLFLDELRSRGFATTHPELFV